MQTKFLTVRNPFSLIVTLSFRLYTRRRQAPTNIRRSWIYWMIATVPPRPHFRFCCISHSKNRDGPIFKVHHKRRIWLYLHTDNSLHETKESTRHFVWQNNFNLPLALYFYTKLMNNKEIIIILLKFKDTNVISTSTTTTQWIRETQSETLAANIVLVIAFEIIGEMLTSCANLSLNCLLVAAYCQNPIMIQYYLNQSFTLRG